MPSTKNIVLGLAAVARFSFALDPCSNDSDCPSGQVCGSGSNTASGTLGPAVLTCQPAPRPINVKARQETISCTPAVGGLDADTGCPEGQVCSVNLNSLGGDAGTTYTCRSITKIKRDLGVRQNDCTPSVDGDDGCPEGESCVNIIGGGGFPAGTPVLAPVVYGCKADTPAVEKRNVEARQVVDDQCTGDEDCADGQTCVWNASPIALTPIHFRYCESSDVVKRGLTPRQGSCTPSIDGDDGCPDGQSCVETGVSGPILAPAIFTCQEDTAVAKAKRDLETRQDALDECTPSSDGNDGCAEGQTCVSNRPWTVPSVAPWYYVCEDSAKVKRTVEARQDMCSPGIDGEDGCPDGQTCTPNRDPSEIALAPLFYTCQPSTKAKRDLEARQGSCTPSIDGDDGCPDGQTCVNINGGPPAILAPAIFGCKDEVQVKRDLVERQFMGCESDADCADGQTCRYLPVSPMGNMPTPKMCMGEATKRELDARANRV